MKTKVVCYAPLSGHDRGPDRPLDTIDRICLTRAQYESLCYVTRRDEFRLNTDRSGRLVFPVSMQYDQRRACRKAAEEGLFPSIKVAESTLKKLLLLKAYRREAHEVDESTARCTAIARARLAKDVLHATPAQLARMLEALNS